MPMLPEQRKSPAGNAAISKESDTLSLAETLDHFVWRLLTDCLAESTRTYWLKRAEDFENAKPRLGESHGNRTPDQLRESWRRCDDIARACRARAEVVPLEEIAPEALAAWRPLADERGAA